MAGLAKVRAGAARREVARLTVVDWTVRRTGRENMAVAGIESRNVVVSGDRGVSVLLAGSFGSNDS